jgi:hypothetical protein
MADRRQTHVSDAAGLGSICNGVRRSEEPHFPPVTANARYSPSAIISARIAWFGLACSSAYSMIAFSAGFAPVPFVPTYRENSSSYRNAI